MFTQGKRYSGAKVTERRRCIDDRQVTRRLVCFYYYYQSLLTIGLQL